MPLAIFALFQCTSLFAQSTGSVNGTITRLNSGAPVSGIKVMQYASGTTPPTTATTPPSGLNGSYSTQPVTTSGFQSRIIRPFLPMVNYRNGISTYDIWLINRHILGIQTLDPLQRVLGDVNGSETLTNADVVALRQLILVITSNFGPNIPSWVAFENSTILGINSISFYYESMVGIENIGNGLDFFNSATLSQPFNFKAMKLGDVNFNASDNARINSNNYNSKANIKADDRVISITNTDIDVAECDVVSFKVTLNAPSNIVAWQQALTINGCITNSHKFLEICYLSAKIVKCA
jgi:hypothetical protein